MSKNLIGMLVREGQIAFVQIDRAVFKKSNDDRLRVKIIRNAHNKAVRDLGFNPKKTFNPSGLKLEFPI